IPEGMRIIGSISPPTEKEGSIYGVISHSLPTAWSLLEEALHSVGLSVLTRFPNQPSSDYISDQYMLCGIYPDIEAVVTLYEVNSHETNVQIHIYQIASDGPCSILQ